METATGTKLRPQGSFKLDSIEIKKARFTLRALDHKLRQKILALLDKRGQVRVTEVYKTLRIEQSEASQHLAILRRAGFVIGRREGKNIYYSVNYPRVDEVEQIARKINLFG